MANYLTIEGGGAEGKLASKQNEESKVALYFNDKEIAEKDDVDDLDKSITNLNSKITALTSTVNSIKAGILDAIYPINSILLRIYDGTNPGNLIGGTWELLNKDSTAYYLCTAFDTSGFDDYQSLPNITGWGGSAQANEGPWSRTWSGALSFERGGPQDGNSGSSRFDCGRIKFDASNSNSIYKNNADVRPRALWVYVWRRTA